MVIQLPVFILLVLVLGISIVVGDILKSAICLAAGSALVAILLFGLDAPWAGAVELSVCAGLITVLFMGAITLIDPAADQGPSGKPYKLAPLAVLAGVLLGIWLLSVLPKAGYLSPGSMEVHDLSRTLWKERGQDLAGQLLMVMAGVCGILSLTGGRKGKR